MKPFKRCRITGLMLALIFPMAVHVHAQEDIPAIPKIAEIHEAAKNGDLAAIKTMLSGRPELVNSLDRQNYYPLHWAVKNGHKEVAKFLIQTGADVNQKTKDLYGFTPLHWASNWDMADFLVSMGADLKARDRYGATVLIWAAGYNRDDVIELLLTLGAEVDEQDMNGWSGLHWAAHNGNREAAEALLENEAAVDIRNNAGETPLHQAVKMNRPPLVKLLLEKGAAVNVKDQYGWTPLHLAAINGQADTVKLLLEKKAALKTRDKKDRTPLQLAIDYGHPQLALELARQSGYSPGQQNTYAKQARDATAELLAKSPGPGQAVIWYMGGSSWAVGTQKHLLVFNYSAQETEPDRPSLANGHINPKEIGHLGVVVFFPDTPAASLEKNGYQWRQSLKGIRYIGDLPGEGLEGYTQVKPGQPCRIGQLEVIAIRAAGDGCGFLVNVDGLSIFHGGGHGAWREDPSLLRQYTGSGVDIAMAATGSEGFKSPPVTLKDTGYLMETLQPKLLLTVSFPGGDDSTKTHKTLKTIVRFAYNRGDHFLYNFN